MNRPLRFQSSSSSNPRARNGFRGADLGLTFLAAAWLAGCATPVGVDKVSPRQSYREAGRNALAEDTFSDATELALHRYDLQKAFRKAPDTALDQMHRKACAEGRRDSLYALAELNYLHAERLTRGSTPAKRLAAPDRFLASAIYAWLFLFGESAEPAPGAFDPRFRLACEFYNRGLELGLANTNGLISPDRVSGARRSLPPGSIQWRLKETGLGREFAQFECFLPADNYRVRGLALRSGQAGIGAPLIAVLKKPEGERFGQHLAATAVLQLRGTVQAWSAGRLAASLELHAVTDDTRTEVNGKPVPLQTDLSTPLAFAVNDAALWNLGTDQFFSSEEKVRNDVYLTEPYVPGRVPVIFVHGTLSSPVWWTEMWNSLWTDPELRQGCQFWYFIYNSGNPISVSTARLRAAILRKIEQLDPDGDDPALQRMVLIGHSQGGLLAKLAATDTGDKLWRSTTHKDFDRLELSPELKETLRQNFFYQPLPCVKRVVFIATPHRGSYLASGLVRSIARKFMKLPKALAGKPAEVRQLKEQLDLPSEVRAEVPTSLDGMSPGNRFLLTLAEIPMAPGVQAHSIIALNGNSVPPKGGDGVVKYVSAHVDYAASECIVRGSHTCQDKPAAIEEVRRILLEHLATTETPSFSPVAGRQGKMLSQP